MALIDPGRRDMMFFDKKPAADEPWVGKLWIYDFRTSQYFTLKQNPLQHRSGCFFVACYKPGDHGARKDS